MKCQNCGHEVPEGSAFCNHCGATVSDTFECPSCHEMIPASSVFCPKCGKVVRSEEAAKAKALRTAWEKEEYDDGEYEEGNSHFSRNLLVIAGIVGALVLVMIIMRFCNGHSDANGRHGTVDSTTVVVDATGDPFGIFNSELNTRNLMADGAITAAAVSVPTKDGSVQRIAGMTYKNDPERSFFKIYVLTRNGNVWDTKLVKTQYLPGRSIEMDASSLNTDIEHVFRVAEVAGAQCFYFAFLNNPTGAREGNNGRVALNLYDVDNDRLTTLNYDGPLKPNGLGGRLCVNGKPLESTVGAARSFLAGEAKYLRVINFEPEEEEEKDTTKVEKVNDNPDNAEQKWAEDNKDKLSSVKEGKEVDVNSQNYDKPIFNMKDMKKKIESGNTMAFTTSDGSVYGFDKTTRKYYVIYHPSSGKSNTDIGFGNNGTVVRMKTSDGHLQYDLVTHKMKTISE